jgi:hypothetical protein
MQWTLDIEIVMRLGARHCTGKREGNILGFPRIHSGMFIIQYYGRDVCDIKLSK